MQSILIGPYSFHGQNAGNRIRRNRRPSSSLSPDGTVLLVKFFVEGVDPTPIPEETWLGWTKRWIGPAIFDDSHHPGTYHPSPSPSREQREAETRAAEVAAEAAKKSKGWGEWVGGAVNGLIASVAGGILPRARPGDSGKSVSLFPRMRKPALGEYCEYTRLFSADHAWWPCSLTATLFVTGTGEVTAELRRDPDTGHYVYTSLYMDVPDARSPNHYRIHIPTDVVGEPTTGLDRLRFWNRRTTA